MRVSQASVKTINTVTHVIASMIISAKLSFPDEFIIVLVHQYAKYFYAMGNFSLEAGIITEYEIEPGISCKSLHSVTQQLLNPQAPG